MGKMIFLFNWVISFGFNYVHFQGVHAKHEIASRSMLWGEKFLHQLIKKLSCLCHEIHPRKLTWNLKIGHPKRKLIFQPLIFRLYAKLRGSIVFFPGCELVSFARVSINSITHNV